MRTRKTACTVPGCDGIYQAAGYCNSHYHHMKAHGHPWIKRPRICTPCHVEGCGKIAKAGIKAGRPVCASHESRLRKYGRIDRTKPRKHDDAAIIAAGIKHCTRCGEQKPLSEFGARRGRAGWSQFEAWCATCKVTYKAERRRTDPSYALSERMRLRLLCEQRRRGLHDLMRGALKRGGQSPKFAEKFGYSIDDLRRHIERQFTKGMGWDAFMRGEIHVDHIIPVARFDLNDPDEVRVCWSMANLRPMWARDNIRKGAQVVSLL